MIDFLRILLFSRKVTGDEAVFLRVPVLVLDGSLRKAFGSLWDVFGHLGILSDSYEKSCHSQDKHVTPIP